MNITEFVRKELEALDNESAISHSALITDSLNKYPDLKTRTGAANRINHVLRCKDTIERFQKIKGNDKKWYIRRSQQLLPSSMETT